MERLTVQQQNNAVLSFINWLKHPNELGKEPYSIEIENLFALDNKTYVILKFQAEENSPWLFGVVGGYEVGQVQHGGLVWSEFEVFDENAQQKCITHINNYNDRMREYEENNIFVKLNNLSEQKKWEEIVALVDENIDKYRYPREEDGKKCLQYPTKLEFVRYSIQHQGENFKSVPHDEFSLLDRKLFALVELKRYDEARILVNELLEIAPDCINILFEQIEIEKFQGNLDKAEEYINAIYPKIWNYLAYARYLRLVSWICIEREDWQMAINVLNLSLFYNDSDYAYNYVNNELGYIKQKNNLDQIPPRPTFKEMIDYLNYKDFPYAPTEENQDMAMSLYDFVLVTNDEQQKQFARDNCYFMNFGSRGAVRMVEVSALTPNKFIYNVFYNFGYQVDKKNRVEFNREARNSMPAKYLSEENGEALIDVVEKNESMEEFVENYRKGLEGEIIEDSYLVCANSRKAFKFLVNKDGFLELTYLFEINPNDVFKITASVNGNHSPLEGDIVGIVSTFEDLRVKK